eukprot:CAMPEP_0117698538 /NCGR_PEP_ID=MMETSP0804-20121206/29810_1 /TAXON_ID=1074897 /ORGANISM="Tetraselmis astigmatica, Strain CCMP880" /LENGTH=659 /DNA_ID=CAMNT_0005512851 /DNA_START=125 /DNA_END=2105 /DNA_ORIENTATION=-
MTEHGIPHNAPSIDCPQAQAHTQAFCGKRLSAAVSVALFFLLGAPVWYRTTQLHRMPLPFERMASTGARAAELPIRIRLWLCTDSVQAGSMPRQTDDHVARILGKLEQLGVSPFTEAGLSIHAVWVTPNGCQTADPLMLLTGEQYAKTGHLRSCPQVHRFVMGELGSDVAVETALQSSIHEIQAKQCNILHEPGLRMSQGEYDLFVLDGSVFVAMGSIAKIPKIVLGQHRLGWVIGNIWSNIPDSSKEMFSGHIATATAMATALLVQGRIHGKSPQTPLVDSPLLEMGALKLLLTLCNAHPPSGSCRWDAAWMEHVALSPVAEALRPLGRVEIDSNVLQYTLPHMNGTWDESVHAFVLQPGHLSEFVDSEWNLMPDSAVQAGGKGNGLAPPHSPLRLVVYVPAPAQRPLQILAGNGTKQEAELQSFSVSSWGGVILLNPEQGCCSDSHVDQHHMSPYLSSSLCQNHRELEVHELLDISKFCVTELRRALGLLALQDMDTQGEAEVGCVPGRRSGFADWEIDMLIRWQVERQTSAVGSTISSLARLVQSLPNLPIPSEVLLLVNEALSGLQGSRNASEAGDYHAAAEQARYARRAADKAFFHPSIMADQSYPVQHLVAMYMPYFLPITVPILQGVWNEVLRRRGLWFPANSVLLSKVKAE